MRNSNKNNTLKGLRYGFRPGYILTGGKVCAKKGGRGGSRVQKSRSDIHSRTMQAFLIHAGAVRHYKTLRQKAHTRAYSTNSVIGGKQMQIAYIAGPYRAKTKLGIIRNVLKARRVAKKYWCKGYAVFCPHLNSALMDGVALDEVFLRGDLEFLKYADILVVIPGWERSTGTLAEIEFAKARGIPIVFEG
jgi:hypothetical protein